MRLSIICVVVLATQASFVTAQSGYTCSAGSGIPADAPSYNSCNRTTTSNTCAAFDFQNSNWSGQLGAPMQVIPAVTCTTGYYVAKSIQIGSYGTNTVSMGIDCNGGGSSNGYTLGPYTIAPNQCYDYTDEFNAVSGGLIGQACTTVSAAMTNPGNTATNRFMQVWFAYEINCKPPVTYSWVTGQYNTCSTAGYQVRSVTCVASDQSATVSSQCNGAQPASQQTCTPPTVAPTDAPTTAAAAAIPPTTTTTNAGNNAKASSATAAHVSAAALILAVAAAISVV